MKGAEIYPRSDEQTFERLVAPEPPIPPPAPPRTGAAVRRGRRPAPRGKLPLMIEREHWSSRLAFGAVVLAVLVGFWAFTQQFWVPAHPGTDQNGYLVGGKMFADHFSTAFTPDDPFQFVGRMWVGAPDGRYFPKYPLGLPVIVAVVLKIGGPSAVYFISPVCTTLALAGAFLIVRQVAGSFAGILGTLILATSPVTLGLTNNPNSHAGALCCATWGMYLLLRWWERGTFWRAALAGALLGAAATLRYTEALLGLPLLLVALFNVHWRRGASWAQAGTLLGCWALPIAALLAFNQTAMGSWTGYGSTHESEFGKAFTWEHFGQNWEVMVRQFANTGLFFTLPIGLMGLTLLLARNWRLSLVLWAWLLPSVLLYTSYYWAPDNQSIGYMRFMLTVFPPVALGAAWCMTRLVPAAPYSGPVLRWVVAPLAALVVVLGAGAYNVWGAIPMLAADQRKALAVARAAEQVIDQAKAPPGSVIFGPREMLHHLQFVGDYRLYASEEFDRRYIKMLQRVDPDEPNGLQPERASAIYELLKNHSDKDLAKLLRDISAKALADGRRVFVIAAGDGGPPQRFTDPSFGQADGRAFTTQTVQTWKEPEAADGDWARRRGKGAQKWRDDTPAAGWQLIEVTAVKKQASTAPAGAAPTPADAGTDPAPRRG
jgi:hypothetical protein